MKKTLAVFALLLSGFSSTAYASTLDILLGTPDTYSISAGDITGNISLPSPQVVPGVNSGIFTGSLSGAYLKPTGISNSTPYLAVFGNGSATYTPSAGVTQFGFKWGSIDPYNSLIITDASHTFTITGSDLAAHISVNFGTTTQDVLFTDPFGPILSVVFSSGGNSFEIANLFQGSTSATPLPGSAVLFMTGLAALLILRRKQII